MFPASSYHIVHTPLGWALLAATEQGLANVQFGDSPEALRRDWLTQTPLSPPLDVGTVGEACLRLATSALLQLKPLPLQLDLRGTPFQRAVWQQLQQIPWGETVSYSELAERLGKPGAVRAVGSACGANRIAWFVPCHRVHRKGGELGAYRWGSSLKEKLLRHERDGVL